METIIFFRGAERLLVVIGGIIIAFLGYRLYRHGITEGMNTVAIESSFGKAVMSGVGPGLFFMMFGSAVLVSSLYFGGIQWTESADVPETAPLGETASASPVSGTVQPQYRPVEYNARAIVELRRDMERLRMINMRVEQPAAQAFAALESRVEALEAASHDP